MFNHLIWNNCVQVVFLSCLGLEIQVIWYFSDTLLFCDVLHKVYTISYIWHSALFCKLVIFDILYWIHNLFSIFSLCSTWPPEEMGAPTPAQRDRMERPGPWLEEWITQCAWPAKFLVKVTLRGREWCRVLLKLSTFWESVFLIVLSRTAGDILMRYKHGAWSRSWEKMVLKHFDLGKNSC